MDADGFLRSELYDHRHNGIEKYCHAPLIIRNETSNLDMLIKDLKGGTDINSDAPIEKDIVLFWGRNEKRIITGADILGRLLKGI